MLSFLDAILYSDLATTDRFGIVFLSSFYLVRIAHGAKAKAMRGLVAWTGNERQKKTREKKKNASEREGRSQQPSSGSATARISCSDGSDSIAFPPGSLDLPRFLWFGRRPEIRTYDDDNPC